MKKELFLIPLTIAISSCHFNENPAVLLSTDDEKIVNLAYSQTYMYPSGFKFQPDLDGSVYFENTVSIGSSETSWIELNTNDQQQAKDWSEISSDKSSYYRDLVSENETEKYIEFKRVNSSNTNDAILSRVHKSSYFVPTFDKFQPTNTIGTLKKRPINKETTKEFIEYLWANNLIGTTDKVLEYDLEEYSDKIRYNLKSAFVANGDFGLCDRIEITQFIFLVEKQSGAVTFESNKIKEINGICH